jgi:Ca2+-binding RTX toxin-like protein
LTWGAGNSLTLSAYSFSTTFQFDSSTATLRNIFQSRGYRPDDSFDYVGAYDTQLQGDVTKIGTVVGGTDNDQLYGGPTVATDPAYWYVVGREGNDSLAGGLSGAILDGGAGDDKFRGSNGITIVRDTFRKG